MSTTDLADRYGTAPTWRRPVLWTAVVATVVASGLALVLIIAGQAAPDVASGNLTFDVVDDRTATARLTVDKGDDVEATCTLKAYAEDHVLVGSLAFVVERGTSGRVEQTVSTDRRATAIELVGCTAPGQNRPR